MAQRKSAPPSRSGSAKSGPGGKPGTARPGAAKSAAPAGNGRGPGGGAGRGPAGTGPARKPPAKGKSIVNQKQTPWGLIAATTAIALFAVAIVVVVIATRKSDSGGTTVSSGGQTVDRTGKDTYRAPELAAAAKISGVTYRVEGEHDHVNGTVKYDASPPIGGKHSQYWANCNGNVYDKQIANENAVHMLEHGAVWVTYNPKTLPASQLAILKKDVNGVEWTALSPYAGLKTPVSLQAWGYQLFVTSASDPRVEQFINLLKHNQSTTPENASCSDPYFDASKSTPGHPQD